MVQDARQRPRPRAGDRRATGTKASRALPENGDGRHGGGHRAPDRRVDPGVDLAARSHLRTRTSETHGGAGGLRSRDAVPPWREDGGSADAGPPRAGAAHAARRRTAPTVSRLVAPRRAVAPAAR